MYRAIKQVLDDRDCRKEQTERRFLEVLSRQQNDLEKLTDELLH